MKFGQGESQRLFTVPVATGRMIYAMKTIIAAVAGSLLLLAGCEEQSAAPQQAPAAGGPRSLAGRSVQTGRGVADQIGNRDAQIGAQADAFSGIEGINIAGLTWSIPPGWQRQEPANTFRAAQLKPPGDCLVTFALAGGDVRQNLDRWAAQVTPPDGNRAWVEPHFSTIAGFQVTQVELVGTYSEMAPDGSRQFREGYMVRGAIVQGPAGNVFIKLVGLEPAVRAQTAAWSTLLESMKRQ